MVPATARLRSAFGFIVPYFTLICSMIPGISFVSIGLTTSGVISRGPMPVPPVMITRSAAGSSSRAALSATASSGRMLCLISYCQPAAAMASLTYVTTVGPLTSA